jgi:hypothetical protein
MGKKTTEHNSYASAKQRCTNPNHERYKDWGGKGIQFLFNSFEEFYAELGEKPFPKSDYSVERIDNKGHYEKGNVRWATAKEQARNRKSNTLITFNGETKILEDWAKALGISHRGLRVRLNRWCLECSLTLPVDCSSQAGRTKRCQH